MGEISAKARDKASGPAWKPLKLQFDKIVETLLSVSSTVYADVTTIYIKFTLSSEPVSPVFAVVWLKSSKRLVVGLALQEADLPDALGPAPKGMAYKGLTGYFAVEPNDTVPALLTEWADTAYQFVKAQHKTNDV